MSVKNVVLRGLSCHQCDPIALLWHWSAQKQTIKRKQSVVHSHQEHATHSTHPNISQTSLEMLHFSRRFQSRQSDALSRSTDGENLIKFQELWTPLAFFVSFGNSLLFLPIVRHFARARTRPQIHFPRSREICKDASVSLLAFSDVMESGLSCLQTGTDRVQVCSVSNIETCLVQKTNCTDTGGRTMASTQPICERHNHCFC